MKKIKNYDTFFGSFILTWKNFLNDCQILHNITSNHDIDNNNMAAKFKKIMEYIDDVLNIQGTLKAQQ